MAGAMVLVGCSASSSLTQAQKDSLGDWYKTASLITSAAEGSSKTTLSQTFAVQRYAKQIEALSSLTSQVRAVASSVDALAPVVATAYQANQLWNQSQEGKVSLPEAIYEATTALSATDLDVAAADVLAVRNGEKAIVESELYTTWKTALEGSSSKAEFLTKVCTSSVSVPDLLEALKANLAAAQSASEDFKALTSGDDFKAMLDDLTKSSLGFSQEASDARTTLNEVSEMTSSIPTMLGSLASSIPTLMSFLSSL
jgi:hypothetical protein